MRHGLSAKDLCCEDEDPVEFAELHRRYCQTFAPVGPVEERLALDLTVNDWRMRRAHRYETQLLPDLLHAPELFASGSMEPQDWPRVEVVIRLAVRSENAYYRALDRLREIQGARGSLILLPPAKSETIPQEQAAGAAVAEGETEPAAEAGHPAI